MIYLPNGSLLNRKGPNPYPNLLVIYRSPFNGHGKDNLGILKQNEGIKTNSMFQLQLSKDFENVLKILFLEVEEPGFDPLDRI